jgi:hypothetical protein
VVRVEAAHRYPIPVERGFAFISDTANWPVFWPGYVRLDPGSRWTGPGDRAMLVTRILGRERTLTMTIETFEPNRLVTYRTAPAGLPEAFHERHFEADGDGFVYRVSVDYEPRPGLAGWWDRWVVAAGIRRAFRGTFAALEAPFAALAARRDD